HSPFAAVPVPTGKTSTSVSNSAPKRAWSLSVDGSPPYGAVSPALAATRAARISGAAPDTLSLKKFFFALIRASSACSEQVRLAILRWRIDRDDQELKNELGLDHFDPNASRGGALPVRPERHAPDAIATMYRLARALARDRPCLACGGYGLTTMIVGTLVLSPQQRMSDRLPA